MSPTCRLRFQKSLAGSGGGMGAGHAEASEHICDTDVGKQTQRSRTEDEKLSRGGSCRGG